MSEGSRQARRGPGRGRLVGLAFAACLVLVASTGTAQDEEDPFADLSDDDVVRLVGLLEAAEQAEATEEWSEALDYYRRAEAILSLDPYRFRQAHCLESLDEPVRALLLYRELADSDVESVAQTAAARVTTLEHMAERLPTPLELRVDPSDARVFVDGEEVGPAVGGLVTINRLPGSYEVTVERSGYETRFETVGIEPATINTASVTLREQVEEVSEGGIRPVSWVLTGTAGALLISGTVLGIVALDRADQERNYVFTPDGDGDAERAEKDALGEQADNLALASTICFVTGGVLAAAAIATFIWLDGDGPEEDTAAASFQPVITGDGAGAMVNVRF